MVTNDSQMKNLTKDKEAAYILALTEHRKEKVMSVRGSNMAAARDVLVTMERIVKEVRFPVYCLYSSELIPS